MYLVQFFSNCLSDLCFSDCVSNFFWVESKYESGTRKFDAVAADGVMHHIVILSISMFSHIERAAVICSVCRATVRVQRRTIPACG
jgi:hypothetical protein